MNILLVYPEYPETFWSFRHALKFVFKKAAYPPLGLLTVASMLPEAWNRKLVDLNVEKLRRKDIAWADYIFVSAMSVQQASVRAIAAMCRPYPARLVGGGPLFTEDREHYPEFDHFVLNEAELTLGQFIHDVNAGIPKQVYETAEFPALHSTPVPDFSLLKLSRYASMSLQYTRGCPFDCEFCDITALYGHKVRAKSPDQVLMELDTLLKAGWKGSVLMVDDNFIGNKRELKSVLLPVMIRWMEVNGYPFVLSTEASINLADDPELMSMMIRAGFGTVFVGIESPVESSLAECNKVQNRNREMLDSVRKIQQAGLEVMAGFIIGFDNDPPTVFQQQIEFIQQSGIISAMVGLLNAPKKTKLYRRLEKEGRILSEFDGNNTNYALNFIPRMDRTELLRGYRRVLDGIYDCKPFYDRVRTYMRQAGTAVARAKKKKITATQLGALLGSMIRLGILDRSRVYYWKLFFWSLFTRPRLFPQAITYSIYGYHYRKVFDKMKNEE